MSESTLSILNVDKYYGSVDQGVHAVRDLTMDVHEGEIVALLGSSGCGKTSTLRMIAGFEEISSGSMTLGGVSINRLAPVKRGVAMAFEGYSLYPPLNVRDNIAFALKSSGLTATETSKKVNDIAEMLEISDILEKYPSSISGGQQQRASLARALVRDAKLHLLDEPMGQLEPQLRALLRGRIKHYIKSNGLTAILVTHDQAEANALADRIAVMEEGSLQQFDSPEAIKNKPENLFTGTFIGEPPMNVFNTDVSCANGTVNFTLTAVDAGNSAVFSYRAADFANEVVEKLGNMKTVVLGVRPYAVKRKEGGTQATVSLSQWLGDQSHIVARIADQQIILVEHERAQDEPGDLIHLHLDPSSLHLFNVENGNAISHGKELS